jgi:hypothetical protein
MFEDIADQGKPGSRRVANLETKVVPSSDETAQPQCIDPGPGDSVEGVARPESHNVRIVAEQAEYSCETHSPHVCAVEQKVQMAVHVG